MCNIMSVTDTGIERLNASPFSALVPASRETVDCRDWRSEHSSQPESHLQPGSGQRADWRNEKPFRDLRDTSPWRGKKFVPLRPFFCDRAKPRPKRNKLFASP